MGSLSNVWDGMMQLLRGTVIFRHGIVGIYLAPEADRCGEFRGADGASRHLHKLVGLFVRKPHDSRARADATTTPRWIRLSCVSTDFRSPWPRSTAWLWWLQRPSRAYALQALLRPQKHHDVLIGFR